MKPLCKMKSPRKMKPLCKMKPVRK